MRVIESPWNICPQTVAALNFSAFKEPS